MLRMQILVIAFLSLALLSCGSRPEEKAPPLTFKQAPQIADVKPQKPAKIKLKRNSKDDYSWEISGDSVDEVVKADRQLRKLLKVE